ncbi:hypothetical protein C8034_v008099 [Colletotrichum sidae]|uniref:Uncharacterized protein n=2 Tax=Colletotrichum orbiculare species complex TaxID=2707354 RepID=A0A4R8QT17_COLTR|nr:hypothetical protein CTRI78_v008717 [Colletotrichum trifolii]TEA20673.1 hypothetical protein C8034_v008099 [Colletotrichum sidae]
MAAPAPNAEPEALPEPGGGNNVIGPGYGNPKGYKSTPWTAAPKMCFPMDGMQCNYENNNCYFHNCIECACDQWFDVTQTSQLITRDCTGK